MRSVLVVMLCLAPLAGALATPTDFNFKDVDLSSVFQSIATLGKFNVVLGADVAPAKVTIVMKQLEPLDALGLVARSQGYRVQRVRHEEGSTTVTFLIGKADRVDPSNSRHMRLRYASAAHVAKSLGDRIEQLTGSRPALDERTNTLILRGPDPALVKVGHLISDLDLPVPEANLHLTLTSTKGGKGEPVWAGSVLVIEGRTAKIEVHNGGKPAAGWRVSKLEGATKISINSDNFGNLEVSVDASIENGGATSRLRFLAAFQARSGDEVPVGAVEIAPGQSVALKARFEIVKQAIQHPEPAKEHGPEMDAGPVAPIPSESPQPVKDGLDLDGI